jgi:serine/threonine-protein kinase
MLGRVLVEQGRPDEAEPLLRKALSDLNATLGATHRQTIGAMSALGLMAMERFRYTEAVATLQAAARTCASIKSGDSANSCTSAAQLLAEALMRDGQLDAASEIAENASERRLALDGDDSPDNAPPRRVQAEILLLQGRAADALPLVDGNIALYVKAGIDQNLDLAAQHVLRARILLVLGRASEALAALDAASPILASRSNHHAARNLRLLATRAFVLAALERPDEARAAAQQAMRLGAASPILDSEEWKRIQAMAR